MDDLVSALRNFMLTDEDKASILRAGHFCEILPLLMKDNTECGSLLPLMNSVGLCQSYVTV